MDETRGFWIGLFIVCMMFCGVVVTWLLLPDTVTATPSSLPASYAVYDYQCPAGQYVSGVKGGHLICQPLPMKAANPKCAKGGFGC